jgi:hypothetical protein
VLIAILLLSTSGAFLLERPARDSLALSSEGTRRGATGFVVAVPHRPVRLCKRPVEEGTFNGRASDDGIPPTPIDPQDCEGIDVLHVDLDHLTRRKVVDGRIDGEADLEGTFVKGVLDVDRQRPPMAIHSRAFGIGHPPCTTPNEGWYHSPSDPQGLIANGDAAVAYMTGHPDVAAVAISRPGGGRYLLLVLVDGDPAPVKAALLKDFPANALCVVQERIARSEIVSALSDPALQAGEASGISGSGQEITDTGDRVMAVTATLETPAMSAAIDRHPAGLVVLHTWLETR